MFKLGVPFFLPVWRRVLVVVVAIAWGLFEFVNDQFLWGIVFLGMGSIATWKFGQIDWSQVADDDRGNK